MARVLRSSEQSIDHSALGKAAQSSRNVRQLHISTDKAVLLTFEQLHT